MTHAFTIGIHILCAAFGVGLLGSAIVVVISFVEDIGELFSSDNPHGEPLSPHPPAP
jgi:hypothetical protein